MPDKNWARWVFASFSKWFSDHRQGVYMYVEGDDADTGGQQDYFEFRMIGPNFEEYSKGWFQLEMSVNILVISKRNDTNTHTLYTNCGIVMAAFETNIPVYKYGSGELDNREELLGCATRCEKVEVSHLGQVNPDLKELQSMVTGYYRMFIEG